jgi:hypothetical protein
MGNSTVCRQLFTPYAHYAVLTENFRSFLIPGCHVLGGGDSVEQPLVYVWESSTQPMAIWLE